ncbi:SMI1/KNR4 family protein [Actinomadura roseirufa]|uniref:SMI1/KNR4 family protein n=1 Tax=Actinomadura roseirufa TaxID=2094049 RepID=UPI00104191B9|nr:SMI1/KNR4 family protein [Actinomadura roseirufa]
MEWKPWLTRWSQEWVSSADPAELDSEVARASWLGFAAASPEDVAAVEARIGVRLPPSYRDFLLTTDGWRNAGMFVWRMRDTSTLGWLRDIEPFWGEGWEEFYDEGVEGEEASNPFDQALMISQEADAGILFLDPTDVDENGEWAAYSHFSWRAEPPTRLPSFTALMEDLYAQFHQMRQPEGETRDSWDAKVEQARLDTFAGDVDAPNSVLEQAGEFGRSRAAVLRAQLLVFLTHEYEALQLLGQLLHPSFMPEGFLADPLFAEEFLPLLFVEHAQNASRGHNSILQSAMLGERPEIHLVIADYQARLRRSGQPLSYGNPEFDSLVRAALAAHRHDPDALWDRLKAALPQWRPRTADHIAPIVLLADPILAAAITPERGRELLSQPRGNR